MAFAQRPGLGVRRGISISSAWLVNPLGLVSLKLHENIIIERSHPDHSLDMHKSWSYKVMPRLRQTHVSGSFYSICILELSNKEKEK